MKIGILKYSTNNIGSLVMAIEKLELGLNISIEIIDSGVGVDPKSFDRLIIPGVGNFSSGVDLLLNNFEKNFFSDALKSGTKILGICLGFQLLFKYSEEGVNASGLGIMDGIVKKFPDKPISPPNFGWRKIYQNSTFINKYYLVHSYYVEPKDGDWISTFNGVDFCAMRRIGNLCGVQFHPEISGKNGSKFLADFIKND
jgi:imidazole glycerol phosphate synthase glutamine amidotransferase subunit